MKRTWWIAGLLIVAVLGGGLWWHYSRQIDYAKLADNQVEEAWLKDREQVPALPFFENGGHYIDFGDGTDETSVDADVVVPLITRLQTEAGMQWKVIPDPIRPGFAYAILAELPESETQLATMNRVIAEQEAKYEGEFVEQRGYRWISFEFLSPEQAEFFRETEDQ